MDFNAGVDRKGRAFESLEAGLLSLQNRREHYSQKDRSPTTLQGGPGLFKQKMIEGLDRRENGERTGCEESSPRLPALSRTDSGLGAIASCFRAE